MRLRVLPLLTAVVAAALIPQLAAADTPIGATAGDTPISAYGGWTAWSSYDAATERFVLTLERDGAVTTAGVATSVDPFDVSVGPDAKGAPVALYTREPTGPRRTRDVYRLDLRSGSEQRLSLSSPIFDEQSPTQWGATIAFARTVKRRSGSKSFKCDVPYLRLGGRSQRLDRGHCASVTGQLLRGTTLLQTTVAFRSRHGGTGPPTTSEIRSVTRSRGSKLLARQGSGEESNLFAGLGADGSFVYSSRFGVGADPSFVRIDRRTGAVREVRAQTELDGGLALDGGRLTYLELQGTFRGGDCALASPCRVVRASADPFGPDARRLAPRLTLEAPEDTQDPAAQHRATQPLTLSGTLTRRVVRGGEVVGTEPVAGVGVELQRDADSSDTPGAERYEATGLTATTGADGAFAVTVPAPLPSSSSFLARTAGPGVATIAIAVVVNAKADVALSASATAVPSGGRVTFSGTVDPSQAGRTVKIQRLTKRSCQKAVDGRTFCQEDFETVADAPLAADGRSFSVTAALSRSGEYTAALPFLRPGEPEAETAYSGRSVATVIAVG